MKATSYTNMSFTYSHSGVARFVRLRGSNFQDIFQFMAV